jgi:hypothetical protein
MPRLVAGPASRIAQATTALLLALLLVMSLAPAARAGDGPTTTDPALAAAGWLAVQVETDATVGVGSLADAIFAFAATGAGQQAAATALAGIAAGLDAYVMPGGTLVPGALAKAMLAVQVQGSDPTSFGGRDLEADLRGLLTVGGPDDGRFGTGSAFDQALAVLALSRTAGGIPPASATWLANAGCPSGEYSWDGSCPAAPGSEDPDTTGVVLQALLAAGETSAADAATAWLLSIQDPDGGFPSFGTSNSSSSGIAAQALRAAGETAAADAAATFVASLQLRCDADAAQVGAIAWAPGIPGALVFSTPQAILAFGGPPFDDLSAAGAAADAPTLDCQEPAPPASSTPAPAPASPAPSAEGELPTTASSTSSDGMLLGAVILAIAGSLAVLRLGRRRAAS